MRTLSLAAGTIPDVRPADAIEVAAAAGFTAVGVWFDPATWTDTVADDVRARADNTGVRILDIEPIMLMPAGSPGSDHGEAIVDAAARIGAHNVLVDNLHLARAGHHPADLASLDARLMPYLQVCDAPLAPIDTTPAALLHEALHGRLLPGDGELPIVELLDAVPVAPISLELRSAALRESSPDPVDRARRVRLAMERAWK